MPRRPRRAGGRSSPRAGAPPRRSGIVADREAEPSRRRPLRHRTKVPPRRQRRGSGPAGDEGNRAIERVGGIDRLQFDQGAPLAAARARHRPQGRGLGQRAARREKRPLLGAGRPQRKPGTDIATEQALRVGADAGLDRGAERADRSDGSDAQHQTGEKDAEPAQAAAQFPASQEQRAEKLERTAGGPEGAAPRRSQRLSERRPAIGPLLADDKAVGELQLPVAAAGELGVVGDQQQRRAAPGVSSNRQSMTTRPVAPSRLPVGSSASSSAGSAISARAIATRCCSPPDN